MRCISATVVVVIGTLIAQVSAKSESNVQTAAVKEVSTNGFQIEMSIPVKSKSTDVYDCFVKNVADWWDKSHTFTADSRNLKIEAKPHGWFLETLPDGGFVRHFEIVYLAPGKTIRLNGGMGPLQEHGVAGSMTINFKPINEKTSSIELTYNVGGFIPGGQETFKQWAPIVKQVIMEQMERLRDYAQKPASDR
ncbi:MAG: hypothetical protein AB8G99_03320 [Planctomycetaceae bacterium]